MKKANERPTGSVITQFTEKVMHITKDNWVFSNPKFVLLDGRRWLWMPLRKRLEDLS